jgi:hypothetical protein
MSLPLLLLRVHHRLISIWNQPKSGWGQQSEPQPCTAGPAWGDHFFVVVLDAHVVFERATKQCGSGGNEDNEKEETRDEASSSAGCDDNISHFLSASPFSSLYHHHHQPHDNSSSSSSQRSNETGEKEEAAAVIHRSSTTPKNTERQPDDVVDYGWKSIEELMCPTTLYNNSCFKSGLTISEYSCCRVPADGGTY